MKENLLLLLKGYEVIKGKDVFGCYNYAPYVNEIFDEVIKDKIVENYLDIYKQIKDKDINTLTLDEVVAYFTYIRRGERFCDGHIAGYLDNGILKRLYERYLKLC